MARQIGSGRERNRIPVPEHLALERAATKHHSARPGTEEQGAPDSRVAGDPDHLTAPRAMQWCAQSIELKRNAHCRRQRPHSRLDPSDFDLQDHQLQVVTSNERRSFATSSRCPDPLIAQRQALGSPGRDQAGRPCRDREIEHVRDPDSATPVVDLCRLTSGPLAASVAAKSDLLTQIGPRAFWWATKTESVARAHSRT